MGVGGDHVHVVIRNTTVWFKCCVVERRYDFNSRGPANPAT